MSKSSRSFLISHLSLYTLTGKTLLPKEYKKERRLSSIANRNNLILFFEHVQKNHIAYETLLIYQTDALLTNGIQEILKGYVKDGIYISETRPYLLDVNEQLIIAYVAGAYLESMRWWITTNYAISPIDMAKTLIELSINGPYIKNDCLNWYNMTRE